MVIRLGGVEMGGTSIKLSLAYDNPTNIQQQVIIPTTTPEETLMIVSKQLFEWDIDVIGIASFGPLDLDKESETYGFITSTPKPQWGYVDVIGSIRKEMLTLVDQTDTTKREKIITMQFGFSTDVNAAAVAEMLYGGHNDVKSLCYITIGTGIGVGVGLNTQSGVVAMTNALHPEAGHIPVVRHEADKLLVGGCPFHKMCCEGFANNHSTAKRAGLDNESQLKHASDDAFVLTGYYIAQLISTLVYTISPHRVIVGGGLSKRKVLIDTILKEVPTQLNGYIQTKELKDITKFIQTSIFDEPGTIGALTLAFQAFKQ